VRECKEVDCLVYRIPRDDVAMAAEVGNPTCLEKLRSWNLKATRLPVQGAAVKGESITDEVFLRNLYAEHRSALLRYVMRVGRVEQETAEDLVQETFLRAWKNASDLRSEIDRTGRSVRPWLLRVSRNLLIDAFRASSARPQSCNDAVPYDMQTTPDRSDQVVTAQELAGALAQLSQRHREVVVHLHCMDRSIPDTARFIGVPPGTVKSRNYYALKELRRIAAHLDLAG
jgi:RNA polymerase sigma-70 factor (ECF subfamily)